MKKILLLLFVSILGTSFSFAQEIDGLEEVREEVKEYARTRVNEFNGYLSYIASKKYDDKTKDAYIKDALNLFIGKGEESKDNDGNIIPAPQMEVSYINRRTKAVRKKKRPIALYLQGMKGLSYDDVSVTASDAVYISDLKKTSDNKYEAVLSYAQIFIGKKDGIVVYKDLTKKDVRVYIEVIPYNDRKIYKILLGDITVRATE